MCECVCVCVCLCMCGCLCVCVCFCVHACLITSSSSTRLPIFFVSSGVYFDVTANDRVHVRQLYSGLLRTFCIYLLSDISKPKADGMFP